MPRFLSRSGGRWIGTLPSHIADEYFRVRDAEPHVSDEVRRRAEEIERLVDEVLASVQDV